jgi:hypothetical protein
MEDDMSEDVDAALKRREEAALEELAELGLKVTIYLPRERREADPLLGIEEGWTQGEVYAVCYSADGRRRGFSGISAVQVLQDSQSWLRWQSNVEPPMRFEIVSEPSAFNVSHRIAGDTATTAARRAATERRLLNFDTGTAYLADAHGAPIEESRASQYPTTESESIR